MIVPRQSDPTPAGNERKAAKAPETKGPAPAKPSRGTPSPAVRRRVRNLVVLAILYGAGLAAVWGFSLMGVSTLVVFPVFVLGVLIASLETDSGLWGGALGLAFLLSYDFLFASPMLELKVLNRTDLVALVIFVAVALIMGVITHRMGRQVQAADRTATALSRLNRLSAGLFESTTPAEACRFSQEFLTKILRRDPGRAGPGRTERSPRLLRAAHPHRLRRSGLPRRTGEVLAPGDEGAHLRRRGRRLHRRRPRWRQPYPHRLGGGPNPRGRGAQHVERAAGYLGGVNSLAEAAGIAFAARYSVAAGAPSPSRSRAWAMASSMLARKCSSPTRSTKLARRMVFMGCSFTWEKMRLTPWALQYS